MPRSFRSIGGAGHPRTMAARQARSPAHVCVRIARCSVDRAFPRLARGRGRPPLCSGMPATRTCEPRRAMDAVDLHTQLAPRGSLLPGVLNVGAPRRQDSDALPPGDILRQPRREQVHPRAADEGGSQDQVPGRQQPGGAGGGGMVLAKIHDRVLMTPTDGGAMVDGAYLGIQSGPPAAAASSSS